MNWKTISRRIVFDQPPWVVVEHHAVQLPDGRVIPDWPWIRTPDYVNVVPVTKRGTFLLLRQAKYGLDAPTLAPVGGYLEPGEEPLEAGRRELLEEMGCVADEWIDLGRYLVDPNRGFANGSFYLAREARRVAEPDADDLEEQELVELSRAELEAALDQGEVQVLAWAAALAFALRRFP